MRVSASSGRARAGRSGSSASSATTSPSGSSRVVMRCSTPSAVRVRPYAALTASATSADGARRVGMDDDQVEELGELDHLVVDPPDQVRRVAQTRPLDRTQELQAHGPPPSRPGGSRWDVCVWSAVWVVFIALVCSGWCGS